MRERSDLIHARRLRPAWVAALAGVAALAAIGCSQRATAPQPHAAAAPSSSPGAVFTSSAATRVTPNREELPNFPRLQRRLPARIGVDSRGQAAPIREPIVPTYTEPELTPEQKHALGLDQQDEPDFLAFYHPQRGPEHGVGGYSRPAAAAASAGGGALYGTNAPWPSYAVHSPPGAAYSIDMTSRLAMAHAYAAVFPAIGVADSFRMLIGEGFARQPAAAMTRDEP